VKAECLALGAEALIEKSVNAAQLIFGDHLGPHHAPPAGLRHRISGRTALTTYCKLFTGTGIRFFTINDTDLAWEWISVSNVDTLLESLRVRKQNHPC
jgi:hypothetical protein